jgi:hypothetical protein
MNDLSRDVETIVLRLLEDFDTSRALSVAILIRHKEWDQLARLDIDPKHYDNAHSFWLDRQATDILRKYKDMPSSIDREAEARKLFYSCEAECFRTNRRLFPLIDRVSNPFDTEGVLPFIRKVRKKISDWLGPCPDTVLGRFGPGATFVDRGMRTTVPHKMSSEPALTPGAWPFLIQWSGTLWASACASSGKGAKFVNGNRFATVPKDSKRLRTIAIEPSINVYFQLAYGRAIRHRLGYQGIHLDTAQDIHRRKACEASTEGHLATLDLSNASDTVSKALVELLLPERWFVCLDDLRSKKTFIDNRWVILEKFSSMGNGFTFELETLIFLAIASAVCEDGVVGENVLAFGDDIIIPSQYSKDVISALKFFGMSVNESKSFVDGPFRESCGGDYFLGVDVRPYYLKKEPNEPQHFIAFANGLRRSASRRLARDHVVHRAWLSAINRLPIDIRRCRGPEGLGDLVIHEDFSEGRWQYRWRSGIRYLRCYRPARYRKVAWDRFSPEVTLAAAIYGVPWNDGWIIPRDSVTGHRQGWVAYS